MGQCVTVSVGNTNDASVAPVAGGGTNVSVGGTEEEDEEEEDGCLPGCLKAVGCAICL